MSKPIIPSTCYICGEANAGAILILDKIRILPIACKCRREENDEYIRRERLEKAKSLNRQNNGFVGFVDVKIDSINLNDNNDSIEFLQNFTKDLDRINGQWFYLYGVCGNGKTTTLKQLVHHLNNNGQQYIFTSVDKIFSKIKESYSNDDFTEQSILNKIINCKFLLLDDVGVERISEWGGQLIYNIFNEKYNNGTSIVMTSNLDKKKLIQYVNTFDKESRVIDRLKEKTTFVKFCGESYGKNKFDF